MRMAPADDPGHRIHRERWQRCDLERARPQLCDPFNGIARLIDRAQHSSCRADQLVTRARELQASPGAQEQLRSELVLERA